MMTKQLNFVLWLDQFHSLLKLLFLQTFVVLQVLLLHFHFSILDIQPITFIRWSHLCIFIGLFKDIEELNFLLAQLLFQFLVSQSFQFERKYLSFLNFVLQREILLELTLGVLHDYSLEKMKWISLTSFLSPINLIPKN